MIRRLILSWRLNRQLAKRKAARPARRDAAKRGYATASRRQFERDPLISALLGRAG